MRRRRPPEPVQEAYPPELATFRLEDWLPGVDSLIVEYSLTVEDWLRVGLARVHWQRARRQWRRRAA